MGTIIALKHAAVAEGLALKLPGWAKEPAFGVQFTEVPGGNYRQLLREIAGSKVSVSALRDIQLKEAAVAEGRALKLPGWNEARPFGVIIASGRGARIDALLLAISKARVVPPVVWTKASTALHWHAVGEPHIYTQKQIAGSPTEDRWQGVRQNLPPQTPPTESDCSSMVEDIFHALKLPDPAGQGYSGVEEYTGTQIEHGTRVATPEAGDLVFYTADGHTACHVAMFVGNGQVVSHGIPGGPQLLDVHNMAGLAVLEYRRYAA